MSTYVLGVYNSEGVWTPSQPIPQGYREANVGQAPYLVQQAAAVPTTPPYEKPDDLVYYQGGMIRGYDNGGVSQQSQTFDIDPLKDRENTNLNVDPNTNPDDTSSVPENPITTPDTPTVTVADQPLTKEQVAQGQADLTAGAILDPAGTAVAAPVSTINPDAEGTVLGATTGQALGTAPIITDPAQIDKTVTADTPDKPPVSKVTTQKAQTGVEDALEDVEAKTSTGPTKTIEAQTQDTTKVSDLEAAQGTTKEIQAQLKADMPTSELSAEETVSGSAVNKGEVAENFGTGEVKAASMQDEFTTLMDQFE